MCRVYLRSGLRHVFVIVLSALLRIMPCPASGEAAFIMKDHPEYELGILSMTVDGDRLYAGSWNDVAGASVYTTTDGQWWDAVSIYSGTDVDDKEVLSLQVFRNKLYAGYRNYSAGAWLRALQLDGEWKLLTGDGFANTANLDIASMAVFRDVLYIGTNNPSAGAELYRSNDGERFERVMTVGCEDVRAISVYCLIEFQGYLYAGLEHENAAGILRTEDGVHWEPTGFDRCGIGKKTT